MSKMNGSSLGVMPNPVSSTLQHGLAAVRTRSTIRIRRSGGGVLDRVGHEVGQHLIEPHRVPFHPHGLGDDVDLAIECGVAGERVRHALHRRRQVEGLPRQPDLAGDNALDVEQFLDQVRDVADLRAITSCARADGVPRVWAISSTRNAPPMAASGFRSSCDKDRQELVFRAVVALGAVAAAGRLEDLAEIGHDQVQAIAVA